MSNNHPPSILVVLALNFLVTVVAADRATAESQKFVFGDCGTEVGFVTVESGAGYDEQRGYGFEPGADVHLVSGGPGAKVCSACVSDKPFSFSVKLPEGNYRVSLTLGDPYHDSDVVIKAESHRLMAPRHHIEAGDIKQVIFDVNIRIPVLPSGKSVSLNDREVGNLTWDDKLTLEFNGQRPALIAMTIEPNPSVLTVFLAGDSTVVDQPGEPWAAWGQMLPRFFKPGVAVANHAESGLSVRRFVGQRRLEKILSHLNRGDYVFIQFGHNDMKEKGGGIGAYESFTDDLVSFILEVRSKGGNPVLVTPMHRRWFNKDGTIKNTFGDYPDAMRKVAQQLNVPLIDLQISSRKFYEAMGPYDSTQAFVHYPANTYPNQDKRLKDDTHHNAYGAYVLAWCVVEGIRETDLDIVEYLIDGLPVIDLNAPPAPEVIDVPASPLPTATQIPAGN